jgi:hypothetical protein
MNSENNPPDFLNTVGRAILGVDTRWVIIGAAVIVGLFTLFVRYKKGKWISRDDALSLGLGVLQLYSAPVLFSLLVLTQPVALDLVSGYQRQSAGLLAFIFLAAGVFIQVKKIWST